MSDFYADLRRELLAAAERDARPAPWRLPRRVIRPALALASIVAAVAVLAAIAGSHSEREREAVPAAPVSPVAGCSDAAPEGGEEPASILGKLAIMRRPPRAGDRSPYPVDGPQVVRVYDDAVRSAGGGVHLVAAEVIPRAAVADGPHCEHPAPPGKPGVCIVRETDDGWMQACFTIAEICNAGSRAWLDHSPEGSNRADVTGVAPDGVAAVELRVDGVSKRLPVRDNVFRGSLPVESHTLSRADVRFR
jgi:hypothetical protein